MTDPSVIQERILDPALDSLAHNHDQALLIYNPSPEVDSLAEIANEMLRQGMCAELVATKTSLVRKLAQSNGQERMGLRLIAGTADGIAKRSNTKARAARWTVHDVARMLRPHLRVLVNFDQGEHVDPMDFVRAGAGIGRVLDAEPSALRRPSLRNELGAVQHGKLMEVWAERGDG